MATRDLTENFVRTRAAMNRRPHPGGTSGGDVGTVDTHIAALTARAPAYVERLKEINDDMGTISTKSA